MLRAMVQAMVPTAVLPYFFSFYSPSISSLSVYVMPFFVGFGDLVVLKNYKRQENGGGVDRLLHIACLFSFVFRSGILSFLFFNFCFFKN